MALVSGFQDLVPTYCRSVDSELHRFCEDVMHTDDWKGCLADINFAITYNFLKWCLCQRTTANGRRKRAIKSKQTLTIHWMKFRLVYERHFFRKINDRVDSRQMRNVSAACVPASQKGSGSTVMLF